MVCNSMGKLICLSGPLGQAVRKIRGAISFSLYRHSQLEIGAMLSSQVLRWLVMLPSGYAYR